MNFPVFELISTLQMGMYVALFTRYCDTNHLNGDINHVEFDIIRMSGKSHPILYWTDYKCGITSVMVPGECIFLHPSPPPKIGKTLILKIDISG